MAAQNGDKVQIFSPDNSSFRFFRGQHSPVVPLFEVESLDDARAQLAGTEATIVGEEDSDAAPTATSTNSPSDANEHS